MITRTLQLYRNSYGGLPKYVWLLSLVMLINRSGAMVLPFLSLYLTSSLNFTLAQAGWVMSAFGLGSVAGSFTGGKLVDRIGHYKVQFGSLFISAFFFIAMIWVTSFWGVCLMIFLTTTVTDAFRPANFAAVGSYTTKENRTRAIALIRMAINLGFALGPAVGGFLAYTYGFHYLFIADGVTCLVASVFLAVSLRDTHETRTQETEIETIDTLEGTKESEVQSPYRDRRYMLFILMLSLNAIAFFQLLSTYPLFFKNEYLLNESQIGLLMAFNGLLIAATEMPLIYVIEKRFSKYQIVMLGTALIGASFWVLTFLPLGMESAVFSMLLITVGEMLSLPFISTLAINRTTAQNRGSYMAVFTMAYSVSHIISANLGMQITQLFGWTFMWNCVTFVSVLACLGFWWMERTKE